MSELAEVTTKPYHTHAQTIVPGVSQKVSFTGTSAVTANSITKGCTIIRIFPTENCYIKIATGSPTATTSDVYCPGGIAQWFGVRDDNIYYLAVIRDTTSGTLHILEGL